MKTTLYVDAAGLKSDFISPSTCSPEIHSVLAPGPTPRLCKTLGFTTPLQVDLRQPLWQ